MPRFATALIVLVTTLSSCHKDSASQNAPTQTADPNGTPSVSWTYLGSSFSATSISATTPSQGTYYYPNHLLSAATGSANLLIAFSSLATGSYTNLGTSEIGLNHYSFDSFVLKVTASSGSTVGGTFTGTYQGQTVSGSFSNVTFQ